MICVSLAHKSLPEILELLPRLEMAEIRLDGLDLDEVAVDRIFRSHPGLIATMRPQGDDDDLRARLLERAVDAGAAYLDVELDAESGLRQRLAAHARDKGCKVIVSFHDHLETPDDTHLNAIVELCFEAGADVAKLACMVQTESDAARLLGLLGRWNHTVVVGMGELGRITRIAATALGSPFSYAAPDDGVATAPGQLPLSAMTRIMRELDRGRE